MRLIGQCRALNVAEGSQPPLLLLEQVQRIEHRAFDAGVRDLWYSDS
jgi:hypothetical protein